MLEKLLMAPRVCILYYIVAHTHTHIVLGVWRVFTTECRPTGIDYRVAVVRIYFSGRRAWGEGGGGHGKRDIDEPQSLGD